MTNRTNRTASLTDRSGARKGRAKLAAAASVACFATTMLATLAATEGTASAQEWLKDRRYQEGAGIRVGDVELHPGIAGEVGYDSNWFLRTQKDGFANSNPIETGMLRITPSFSLSTLTQKRLEDGTPSPERPPVVFRGGVSATYREFLSGNDQLRDQRNVSANADARLDINQGKPVGFGVFAGYQRLIQPSVVADPNLAFNRSDVNAGAEVIGMPGGGTFDIRGGYTFYGALFEESNGVPYTSLTHELSVKNRWRFRPRTALFQDTSLRFINYPNAQRALLYLNDSTPLRTRFGVTGLLTDRFGTLLAVGYGATFFKTPTAASTKQFDSFTAQAEGTFYLSTNPGTNSPGQASLLMSTFTFGYMRDFQNSLLGNFYDSHKGYLRLVYFFGGKVLAQLDGDVEALGFPPVFLNNNPTAVVDEFTNIRVGGKLFAEYRFSDSFGINTTLDYHQMISDTQIPAGGTPATPGTPPAAGAFDLNWQRFQAFVGARWFL